MNISVYDTHVQRKDGVIMHFDILVPDTVTDETIIHNYGHKYLASKPFEIKKLSAKECRFCHIEQATASVIKDIEANGYSIIEFENCN